MSKIVGVNQQFSEWEKNVDSAILNIQVDLLSLKQLLRTTNT